MLVDEADTNGLSNETSLLRRDLQDSASEQARCYEPANGVGSDHHVDAAIA